MKYFVGLDWGSTQHAACVIDAHGILVARFLVEHSAEGLQRFLTQLARLAPPQALAIAIERPDGLVVDTLLHAGHPVVPVHPNALKACRPRYRAAGAKSDPDDAYILADVLRTDGHRLRPLHPASDEIRALRALVRSRDDLVAERIALANQLRSLLDSFWPGAAAIFTDIDSSIALAFLDRYPTPQSARRLGHKRLASFLASHHYSGRRPPTELLKRLRAAPTGLAGEIEQEAKGELVQAFVAVLRSLVERLHLLTRRIEHDISDTDTGRIMMSFPRAGQLNAAQIVAELGEDPERFQTEEQLAAEAGTAPVTHASGKRRNVLFRYACNKRLRLAITTWAANSRFDSPWAKYVYDNARARGCNHPHAVRILARAWVRVLWRCWRNRTPYQAALHGAAKSFLQAA
jgi:transposase